MVVQVLRVWRDIHVPADEWRTRRAKVALLVTQGSKGQDQRQAHEAKPMKRTEQAIDDIVKLTIGLDAPAENIRIFRAAISSIIELAIMETELNRVKSLIQVKRAMSDQYDED